MPHACGQGVEAVGTTALSWSWTPAVSTGGGCSLGFPTFSFPVHNHFGAILGTMLGSKRVWLPVGDSHVSFQLVSCHLSTRLRGGRVGSEELCWSGVAHGDGA